MIERSWYLNDWESCSSWLDHNSPLNAQHYDKSLMVGGMTDLAAAAVLPQTRIAKTL